MMRRSLLVPLIVTTISRAAFGADLSVADARVVEGDTGERSVEVTITLSQPATGPVSATYRTQDGSALTADYRPASGMIAFTAGEVAKKIAVRIVGDTATEMDEVFDVALSTPSGAGLADGTGRVTIVNDDFATRSVAGRTGSIYEVRLTFVGHTGTMAKVDGCPVRNTGTVVMTGLVGGPDNVARDDDIVYEGVLQLDVDVDLCDVRSNPNGMDELCAMRVIGAAPMAVDLSVHPDDRGAYIRASKAPGAMSINISGGCDQPLMTDERALFPDDTMATMFNGLDLELPSGPLRVGRYVSGEVVVEVLRVMRP